MSTIRLAVLALSGVAFLGCGGSSSPPPHSGGNTTVIVAAEPQPAFVATPKPAEEAHKWQWTVADGRPKGLHSGHPESYWVWHDGHGKHWHIRTTTHTQLHRFHGWVAPESGHVTEIKPTRLEWADRIRAGEHGIEFDFHTKGHEDGFDFETSGECVKFYLLIDGKAEPGLVKVGASDAHPEHAHFMLCP